MVADLVVSLGRRLLQSLIGIGLAAVAGGPAIAASVGEGSLGHAAGDCARLAAYRIKASSIGMPTTGAVVTDAHEVAAGGRGASAIGDYCLASGSIMPVDPKAPKISFQVALPSIWNSKVLMLGGAGFDGIIPKVAGNLLNTTADALAPLGRGYAVFASDSGHQSTAANPVIDGSFALNREAYLNWIGDALKKTHDAALVLVKARYGKAPTRSYFVGSSTGGREALTAAGRWPADWNGVVALYPGRNPTVLILGLSAVTRAFAATGAYLDAAKRGVLYRAALAACDALDGASDGLISNVRACEATFDPSTAKLNGASVRCPGGADTGDTCLSDAQIAAIKEMNSAVKFKIPPFDDRGDFPGYNIFTLDGGIPSSSPYEPTVSMVGLGNHPPTFLVSPAEALSGQLSDSFIRYVIARDPSFNSLTLDPSNLGRFASRVGQLSSLDNGDANLSGFAARGGKALIMQGTGDLLVSPRATELYVRRLPEVMGKTAFNESIRYYEVPGFAHAISTQFNASWDQLTALENWVEKGRDPGHNQVVTDTTGVPGRTRPLCLYPTWPRYTGFGDMNSVGSFTCASH